MSEKIFLKELTLPITDEQTSEVEEVTYHFVQTDDELETAGDAADAKVTGDALNNLKGAFTQNREEIYTILKGSSLWSQGTPSVPGASNFVFTGVSLYETTPYCGVYLPDGWTMNLAGWDASGSFVGYYKNDGTFVAARSNGTIYRGTFFFKDIIEQFENYSFAIVAGKTGAAPSAAADILIYVSKIYNINKTFAADIDRLRIADHDILAATLFDIRTGIEWGKRTVNSSGKLVASNTTIMSLQYIPKACGVLEMSSAYRVSLYAWDIDDTFIGNWNGAVFNSSVTRLKWLDLRKIYTDYPTYNFRIAFTTSGIDAINISEISNLVIRNEMSVGTIDRLEPVTSKNLFSDCVNVTIVDEMGITIAIAGGVITVTGTASTAFLRTIPFTIVGISNKIPYYVHFSTTKVDGVWLQVREGDTVLKEFATDSWVKFSNDNSTATFRLVFAAGVAINASFRPTFSEEMTNHQITNRLNFMSPLSFPPMLTIIDDDGHKKFYQDILPVIQSKKVSITAAVPNTPISESNFMSWEEVKDAYSKGAEIISHNLWHMTTEEMEAMSEEEIEYYFTESRNRFFGSGIHSGKYLAYNGGTGNLTKVLNAARKVFDVGIYASGSAINMPFNMDVYKIKRYSVYNFDSDDSKALVDACVANGGWMVWMTHTSDAENWTAESATKLANLIDYARTVGLPIVSVDYVYKKYLRNLDTTWK